MKTTFNWGDDVIDSRSIIERHEELQDEFNSLVEALNEAQSDFKSFTVEDNSSDDDLEEDVNLIEEKLHELHEAIEEAQEALNQFNQSFDKDELDTLTEVISQGEDSPDWSYGETLIRDEYFQTYIEDLINDCYELPKEMNSGYWPYRHLEFDYVSAADEAKMDYMEIEVDAHTYFLRD